jgi:putative RecB family exonuclease
LCSWCDHQAICPAFGGQPPELPLVTLVAPGRRDASAEALDDTDPSSTVVVAPLEEE